MHLKGIGDGRDEEIRGLKRLEGDKINAVAKVFRQASRALQRQARLSYAARPHQREQAAGRVGQ
jgi:hypothetical protein